MSEDVQIMQKVGNVWGAIGEFKGRIMPPIHSSSLWSVRSDRGETPTGLLGGFSKEYKYSKTFLCSDAERMKMMMFHRS